MSCKKLIIYWKDENNFTKTEEFPIQIVGTDEEKHEYAVNAAHQFMNNGYPIWDNPDSHFASLVVKPFQIRFSEEEKKND